MIASFTLKIDFNLQLLFIGSAWFYSLILFITNKLKKFNFSSELVEQRINNLKKSLGEFYTLEPEKVDTTIDNYVKDLLDKLKKFEILNKYIVIGLLIFLTLLFIIVFLAK
ncbi:hypothetical protein TEHD86_2304 [Tetragenococcus halophilus subsp. halophilus]|nr:hypothetical protein TEHD86_2304 [Tetragenococcus halophilus subsp. halophilus]